MILRPTVRAVIVRDRRLLVLEKRYADGGEAVSLPGGAQDPGESIPETARRECREEIAAAVVPGALVYVFEHLKRASDPSKPLRHKVEIGLRCEVPDDYEPSVGPHPDPHQVGVCWVPIDTLGQVRLRPAGLAPLLLDSLESGVPSLGGRLELEPRR